MNYIFSYQNVGFFLTVYELRDSHSIFNFSKILARFSYIYQRIAESGCICWKLILSSERYNNTLVWNVNYDVVLSRWGPEHPYHGTSRIAPVTPRAARNSRGPIDPSMTIASHHNGVFINWKYSIRSANQTLCRDRYILYICLCYNRLKFTS